MTRRRAIILGSTGSIGRGAIDVMTHLGSQWEVSALAARSNWHDLAQQANRLRPAYVALSVREHENELRAALAHKCKVLIGPDAMIELLEAIGSKECDCVVCAVVGSDALAVTLRAVQMGLRIALANKESLVMAGAQLMRLAARTGASIIPIDSEHSAILQAMQAGRRSEVRRVCLTASGGPFRTWTAEEMRHATLDDALRHPTWKMGPKVTIDSATMMNKALEIVEARWLFGLEPNQIQVVIHPESIIHSFVEFCDGAWVAQLGAPDMRVPIQYALTFPERVNGMSSTLDLKTLRQLTFEPPDPIRFPAIRLGHEVAGRGGTTGAVLNGANEAAVQLFRRGAIPFGDITRLCELALAAHESNDEPTLEDILRADHWARDEVHRCLTCR